MQTSKTLHPNVSLAERLSTMTTRELNDLNELNKDAQGILKVLAAIERDSNAHAEKLAEQCDLDSQTVLFLANESVAPAVFADARSKAKVAARLRVVASDALDARIRALASFTASRSLETISDYALQVSLAKDEMRALVRDYKKHSYGV
jgi:hypothetical protein